MSNHSGVARARKKAEEAHFGLTRKGELGEPSMNHLVEVAQLVAEAGGSAAEIAASFMHDAVEDTPMTMYDIRQELGDAVGDLVEELTDPPEFKNENISTAMKKVLQAEHYKDASMSARLIKLADQISNVRSLFRDPPVDWSKSRKADYLAGAALVAHECKEASPYLYKIFREEVAKAGRV